MSLLQALRSRLGIVGELLGFFARHRWWWLMPMLLALLALAVFVLLGQSSAIAPFVYTLF